MKTSKAMKRNLDQWLADYAVSHQNPINKKIHWLCVPTIFVSILGMGMSLSAWITIVLTMLISLFYLKLSMRLFVAMGIFTLRCLSAMALLPLGF